MDKNQQSGASNAAVSMTQTPKEKTPAHLYHPGVAASVSEGADIAEPAIVAGKRRRSSDSKKVSAKKRRKSQGDVENCSGETAPVSKSVESSPVSKMSPTSIRGKRGSFEGFEQEDLQLPHETRSARGKKVSSDMSAGAAFSTATTTVSTSSATASVTTPVSGTGVTPASPVQEPASHSRSRRAQRDSSPPSILPQISTSPSRKGQPPPDSGNTSPRLLSSPTRSRRNAVDPQPPSSVQQTDQEPTSCSGTTPALPTVDSSEAFSRRRAGSSVHLDTSVESLPSVTSLHSPTSESFHSADDDPSSPRKEKRHRDGSKKKKKDKDKELEGGRKKKKHHHRDKHGLGEMASEMVTPVRIKVST